MHLLHTFNRFKDLVVTGAFDLQRICTKLKNWKVVKVTAKLECFDGEKKYSMLRSYMYELGIEEDWTKW